MLLQQSSYLKVLIHSVVVNGVAGENLTVGSVLYKSTDGKVYKAKADNETTSKVIGCSHGEVSVGSAVSIIPFGIITNTSWALSPENTYYLSPYIAGSLVITPPDLVGQFLVPIGIAASSTQLVVSLQRRTRM